MSPDRTRGRTHSSVAPPPVAVVATCSTVALRSRSPWWLVSHELLEARLLDPAHVGIVDAGRAAEEVAQAPLVARDEEGDVAGDGVGRHRRGIRPIRPGPPGVP